MDNLELIDAYFQNSLTADERREFEKKCVDEKSFAEEVAFYVSARKLLKEELIKTKGQSWEQEAPVVSLVNEDREPISIERRRPKFAWIKYAAAACLVLALATYIFERPVSTQQLAHNYFVDHYTTLPQNMGTVDDFESAKQAYNEKDHKTAITILNGILSSDTGNTQALKLAGIVYLADDDYDKALIMFDKLSTHAELFANPGMFLKAVTLLKRNKDDDKEQARILLQQVVAQGADGSKEAKEWLKKF